MTTATRVDRLSIVIPVYNDREVLAALYQRLAPVASELAVAYEIVFVDDGSGDGSFAELVRIACGDPGVVVIRLARNFGQAQAIAAGLRAASGDIVVVMDSDLQDRPEDIPRLVAALRDSGSAMAIARWATRAEGRIPRLCRRVFGAVSARLTNLPHVAELGVFRAITRTGVDAVKDIPETTGTLLSLLYWSGLSYVTVDLHRDARAAGRGGYNLRRLCALTADRVFSYSLVPVRAATWIGLLVGAAGVGRGLYLAFRSFGAGAAASGGAWWGALALGLAGLNFVFIGMVGEYLGRIYRESRGRPGYIVEQVIRSGRTDESGSQWPSRF